jgi:hypothetical protein
MLDALLAKFPALASAMSFEGLEGWRQWLDAYAHNEDVDATLARHEKKYRARYGDAFWALSEYQDEKTRIEAGYRPIDDKAPLVALDPGKILGADVAQVPAWNVAPETRFRTWAAEHFASKPLFAELTDQAEVYSALQAQQDPSVMTRHPHINVLWGGRQLDTTGGSVTFADLLKIPEFGDAYRDQVSDGPEVQALRNGIKALEDHIDQMRNRHRELSDKNRGAEYGGGWTGWAKKKVRGAVRHVSEELGAPSYIELAVAQMQAQSHPNDEDAQAEYLRLQARAGNYPPLAIWNEPQHKLDAASRLMSGGQIELATGALQEAEQDAANATMRFAGYEERVMGGAGIAVKWLERAKTAGKIASAFTGVTGVVRAAAFSAGYTATQEGLEEASATFLDPEHHADFGKVARMAAVDGLAALFGGLTQGAFTNALKARFAGTLIKDWQLSESTAEAVLSIGGATTASFYNVPAKVVLDRIIDGKAMPSSLSEVCDMVVTEAITSGAMDIGGSIVKATSHQPGKEAGQASGEAPPGAPGEATAEVAKPGTAAAEPSVEHKIESALAGGAPEATGKAPAAAPGASSTAAGPVSAEVAQLAAQLHPIREQWQALGDPLARAHRLVTAIEPFLAQTGVPEITGIEARTINGARLDFTTWTLRVDVREFEASAVTPERFAELCGLVRHELEHAVDWFRMARVEAARSGDNATDLAKKLFIPEDVARSAIEANVGHRPAEDLSPGSPLAQEAQAKFDNVYGTAIVAGGATRAQLRTEILTRLESGWEKIEKARQDLATAKQNSMPGSFLYDAAERQLEAAIKANEPDQNAYLAFPEEVAAYRAGGELTAAMQRQWQRLGRAKLAMEEAYNLYKPLQDRADAVLQNPGEHLALDELRALDRARDQWIDATHHVRKLEHMLGGLQPSGAKP